MFNHALNCLIKIIIQKQIQAGISYLKAHQANITLHMYNNQVQDNEKTNFNEQKQMEKNFSQKQLDGEQEQLLDRDIQQQSQKIINKMTRQNEYENSLSNIHEMMQESQQEDPNMPRYDLEAINDQVPQSEKLLNGQNIEQIKNPVSAYMVFVKNWKRDNPDKKMNLSEMGNLFKALTQEEKIPLIQQYKRQKELYDAYRLHQHVNNPNPRQLGSTGVFPLHRVKCIMKQDSFYAPKAEAVESMGKATQYFAEYFLEEIKKLTQGKNRVQAEDMYQCITVKNKVFGFLQCLIDEKNLGKNTANEMQEVDNGEQRKANQQRPKVKANKAKVSLQIQNQDVYRKPVAKVNKSNQKNNKVPENQMRITDMFKR